YNPETGEFGPDVPGAVYVFEKNADGEWVERQKLEATPLEGEDLSDDDFGTAVDIDGTMMVVGAPFGHAGEPLGTPEGVAYIFERENGVWTQRARLTDPDGAEGDGFGRQVAISGNRVLVAALNDRHETGAVLGTRGSVSVFARSNAGWTFEAKLAPTLAPGRSGRLNSIAIDGNMIVLGSSLSNFGAPGLGMVWVYTRTATGWGQPEQIG